MTNKIAVVIAQDTHINSAIGLCIPSIELDDGGQYRASRGQRWLWDCFSDFVDQVRAIKDHKIVVVLNGDLGELDVKRRSSQLVSSNKATIMRLAIETLSPLVDVADAVFVLRGTLAHSGKSSWLEEAIAQDFDNVVSGNESVASFWHLRHVFSNVRFDITHHARMGGIARTQANYANMLAFDTISAYHAMEAPAPHIIYRGHNHRRADSGSNFGNTIAILGPAWQLATEFVYRIGAENSIAHIGGDVFYCDDGEVSWQPHKYKLPNLGRKVWAMRM
jgi:hypothetical protein